MKAINKAQKRPRIRDPLKTQERILKHATAEFVRWGYQGARVDRISTSSGTSKNLIYNYFKGKEDLYIKCLERVYLDLRRKQDVVFVDTSKPLDAIISLTTATFDTFEANPEIMQMLAIENLNRGHFLRKSVIINSLYNPLIEKLRLAILEGQNQGMFRKEIDLAELYVSVSALCYFYFSNKMTLSVMFKEYYAKADAAQARKQHVIDMVTSYVLQDGK